MSVVVSLNYLMKLLYFRFYDALHLLMSTCNLLESPHLIFNCDETGLYKPSRVVGRKGSLSIYTITSGKKGQITVMACANASGVVLPPGIIFKGKKENKIIITSAPASWSIQFSEKGWMTSSTFLVWLKDLSIA